MPVEVGCIMHAITKKTACTPMQTAIHLHANMYITKCNVYILRTCKHVHTSLHVK